MEREEQEFEINFPQLFRYLWKRVWAIVLALVLCGGIGFASAQFFTAPVYEASAKMIINTRNDTAQNVTSDQISSAQRLVDTYAIIIRSRTVLSQVIDELGLSMRYETLNQKISVSSVNGTQIIKIAATHTDPYLAVQIVDKILSVAPAAIMETVEAGSVKTVEGAYCSGLPVSPNVPRNTVLFALLGAVLACGVLVAMFLTDTTFKSELDIQEVLSLPVLGVIPSLESCSGSAQSNSRQRRSENKGGIRK